MRIRNMHCLFFSVSLLIFWVFSTLNYLTKQSVRSESFIKFQDIWTNFWLASKLSICRYMTTSLWGCLMWTQKPSSFSTRRSACNIYYQCFGSASLIIYADPGPYFCHSGLDPIPKNTSKIKNKSLMKTFFARFFISFLDLV